MEKYWQATDDNMAHANCMLNTDATDTQSGNVILIAFPLQKWSHERASMSHYSYVGSLFTVCTTRSDILKFYVLPANIMRFMCSVRISVQLSCTALTAGFYEYN